MISVIGRLDKSFKNISETPNEQGKQLFLAYVVKFEEENEVFTAGMVSRILARGINGDTVTKKNQLEFKVYMK
ncbi:hypothetical protein [Bacillus amyloliquefaciens]|uniref:hypothetical protein n=1 Tax=Bacillus amyloliquefaciens TaxID=1390 RepID=UPI003A8B384E